MPESSLSIEKVISSKSSNPLRSPDSGAVLTKTEDSLYHDEYGGLNYSMDKDGKIIGPPKSPDSKAILTKGDDGLYYDEHGGGKYMAIDGNENKEKTIIALRDPMSGGELLPNDDGTFLSKSTGKNFTLYNEHFVPLYVPDNTLEPAHIENGRLIGNDTGRSFEISHKGVILTPEEIEHQRAVEEDVAKLIAALKNAEEEVNRSILKNMADLGQSLESAIKESLLAGETNEQLNQKLKELEEKSDEQLKAITETYRFKLENITQVLKPEAEPNPEAELESKQEPKSELKSGFEPEPE